MDTKIRELACNKRYSPRYYVSLYQNWILDSMWTRQNMPAAFRGLFLNSVRQNIVRCSPFHQHETERARAHVQYTHVHAAMQLKRGKCLRFFCSSCKWGMWVREGKGWVDRVAQIEFFFRTNLKKESITRWPARSAESSCRIFWDFADLACICSLPWIFI